MINESPVLVYNTTPYRTVNHLLIRQPQFFNFLQKDRDFLVKIIKILKILKNFQNYLLFAFNAKGIFYPGLRAVFAYIKDSGIRLFSQQTLNFVMLVVDFSDVKNLFIVFSERLQELFFKFAFVCNYLISFLNK